MTTRFCKICFELLKIDSLHSLFFNDICICSKCFNELSPSLYEETIDGIKGLYLFKYNDVIKEKIYTFKGCGDIELSKVFLNYYKHELHLRYKKYVIVPAPSDINSDNIRGFNHVKEIFKELNLPIVECLYKTKEFKQSDLKKNEREKISENLAIRNIDKLSNQNVLFVDDISTTGSTLKACIKLIKKANIKKLQFLIVAKVENKNVKI